jgi:hypothetical protein
VRPLLVRRLLLSGGSAFLPGLGQRVITELSNLFLLPRYTSLLRMHHHDTHTHDFSIDRIITNSMICIALRDRLRLVTPNFPPNILAWIGGSLVSCMELPRRSFINAKRFADRRQRVPDWTSGSSSSTTALTSSISSSTSTTPAGSMPGTPGIATPTPSLTPFGSRLTISVTSTSSGHTRGSSIGGNWALGGVTGSTPSPLSSQRRPLTVVTQLGSPQPSPSPRMHASQSFGAALSAMRLPTGTSTATLPTGDGKDNSGSGAAGLLSPPHQ